MGEGVVLGSSSPEIGAYICPLWARGNVDNSQTHRNPLTTEWHKSYFGRQAPS